MVLPFSPRVRALVIVCLLVLAALAAATMMLGRKESSTEAKPAPEKPKAAPAQASGSPAEASPSRPGGAAKAPAASADRLPAAIAQALAANRVVVVSLYAPRAKVDAVATREAAAGAQLAGAVFVPIDVTKSQVDSLNRRYGALHDPAVLVLRPPGDLIVRIDGFADRDTVAQAAANAAS